MTYKLKNNAETTLAVGMNTTATTLQVATGKGDLFPVISGSDHSRVTLENAAGDIEIMKVTARALGSDSMTVVRAQEGTTAKTWLIGDIVELRVTAATVEDLQAEASAGTSSAVAAHEAAADPHPVYLTQAEGDGLYQTLAATATKAGVQAQSYTAFTAAGTDTYTATPSPALTAYAAEQRFQITFTNANTGAATTLNLNGLGAKALKKQSAAGKMALVAGEIPAGGKFDVVYDGTDLVIVAPLFDISKQTAWIPAGAMTARTTSGAAAGTVETATNKLMLKTLDFDAAAAEYAQFHARMPKGWNKGTVTAYFLWSNASGTGDVVWAIQGVAISNDDILDAAFGTAVSVTDGVTAAGDLMQSAETGAVTIGGTPVEGDWVVFQVYRDAANAADTLAGDARLHGVVLIYSTASMNDA